MNMPFIVVTSPVSQRSTGWLYCAAPLKVSFMDVTCCTDQYEMRWLKRWASWNVPSTQEALSLDLTGKFCGWVLGRWGAWVSVLLLRKGPRDITHSPSGEGSHGGIPYDNAFLPAARGELDRLLVLKRPVMARASSQAVLLDIYGRTSPLGPAIQLACTPSHRQLKTAR